MSVSSSSTRNPSIQATTYVWIEEFNPSKIIIRSGMTSFISYSNVKWIAFPCPT